MGRRVAVLKTKTEYLINFYYPKKSKTIDDFLEIAASEKEAIKIFKKECKEHSGEYDIKLFKVITNYEEIKIEK